MIGRSISKGIFKSITSLILAFVLFASGAVTVPATTADYYDSGFCRVGGVFVNSAGAPIQGALRRGVDVSYHQGNINWAQVAQNDIQFAFVRAGSFKSGVDSCFYNNMQGAVAAGIQVGIYVYSYASTPEMASQEGLFAVSCARNYPVSLPLVFDIEGTALANSTPENVKAMADSFTQVVESAGYKAMVYSSKNQFDGKLSGITQDRWVAQYAPTCQSSGYAFWQCSNHGYVPGIEGRVDINFQFKDYSAEIPANGFKTVNGKTFYMENYIPHKGWVAANGKRYYMDTLLGVMQRGLVSDGNAVYFMGDDGAMMTGIITVGDFQFYFNPDTGALVTNSTVTVGKKSYLIDQLGVLHAI